MLAAMSSPVLLAVRDRVATVTLNRPAVRNALSREVLRLLPQLVEEADAADDVDVIVLTGADPAFCAGLDLAELASPPPAGAEPPPVAGRGPLPITDKPVIGAINGPAITGGFELALNCDFLVASDRAKFGDTHARVGVMPGWGLTVLLPQAIGVRRAREMSYTGNFMSAQEALQFGLVNHVVPHDELLPFTYRLAADIAGNDQAGVRQIRRTYAAVADDAAGWATEAADAAAWRQATFDPAAVAARRAAIEARGHTQ
jgi:enoyl-CoA hydratase